MLLMPGLIAYSGATKSRANLKQGDRAPFEGILLTRRALAKIITKSDAEIKKLKLDLEKARVDFAARINAEQRICQAKLVAEQSKLSSAKMACRASMAILEGAIKKVNGQPPWYTAPSLNQVMGCAVCGGLCVAITFAVSQK